VGRVRRNFRTTLLLILAAAWPGPVSSAPAGWPDSLTIGTGSPGGVYFPYGERLAAILTEALGIPVTGQATQGPDQNILLIESGDAQIGLVTTGVALQAWRGTGEWTHGKQHRAMRALFPMYDSPFQFAAFRNSGIRSFAGMAGKRIGVGPAGSTAGTYMADVDKTLRIQAILRNGSYSLITSQMRSHLLDIVMQAGGVPAPMFAEINAVEPLEFIALSETEIATLREAMPEFGLSVIPAGAYPWLAADYKTIGLYNFGIVSKELANDLAYAIVKAFYANHDRMVQPTSAARESVTENLSRNTFIPYHPGAVRYYREIGVELPADLVPAD
jgi:uncharacterized protein